MMAVKVGDKIRITDIHWASIDKYKEGDVFTVLKVDSDGDVRIYLSPEDDYYLVVKSEFEVLPEQPSATNAKLAELEERIATLEAAQPSAQQAPATPQYRKVTGRSPKVGDYVKYDEAPESYLTAGKYYEINEIDGNDDPQITDDEDDNWDTMHDTSFEVYEKVKQTDKQPQPTQTVAQQPQPLKVGDKVRLLNGGESGTLHGFTNGGIYEVVEEAAEDGAIEIIGDNAGWAKPEQLEKLSEEEVAEIKLTAKFAEIGRAVGEFRAGDIVKFIGEGRPLIHGLNGHEGVITEVEVGGTKTAILKIPDHIEGNGRGTSTNGKWMELITPVERRFDRD